MPKKFAIIDLFAGPGGLGEGLSRAGESTTSRMKIHLSVEMDGHAVQTLRLRAFLRSFEKYPDEYYAALCSGNSLPDWPSLYPAQWQRAEQEVQQRVLGAEGVFDELAAELDHAREVYRGDTILIGGPPCQAYSLAGRSRNMGKTNYVLENDSRHYLYREYVKILERLRPAAFVMENVKGMLSSKVDGGGIFHRVLDDLEGAGEGYRLLPLAKPTPLDGARSDANGFLIRAEEYGVPQTRHRVIILGIRSDLASNLPVSEIPLGDKQEPITVHEVICGLSSLRSGLSKRDSTSTWQEVVREQAARIAICSDVPNVIRTIAQAIELANDLPQRRQSSWRGEDIRMPDDLRAWFDDPRLKTTLHHDTRGHIPEDLGRYIFSAAWTRAFGRAPKLDQFPAFLQPEHRNRATGAFADRFRTQAADRPSSTITSHISKDGHYFIHPDVRQCRSLTVREAARLQTFPDNYFFCGPRTKQYHQVGNAVPPLLAYQIGQALLRLIG